MIRVNRGREPAFWSAMAATELRRVRAALAAGDVLTEALLGIEYKRARPALRTAQHFKCCYCEHTTQRKHEHVEHFRPKLRARRSTGCHEPGYWWLTWDWSNLLFACKNCNNTKLDRFPLNGDTLGHRGHPLATLQRPPGRERPELIDPGAEDGGAMIQFRRIRMHHKQQWRPFPRSGSVRGHITIHDLSLDRDELIDLYTSWAKMVEGDCKVIRKAIRDCDRVTIRTEWNGLLRRYYHVSRPFTQLSLDVLDHLVPASERQIWKLKMPSKPWRR